jgi:hypothetical protein
VEQLVLGDEQISFMPHEGEGRSDVGFMVGGAREHV